MSSGTGWIDIIPSNFPSFGSTGHELGHYYALAYYLVTVPIGLFVVAAIVYNVFVGIATCWMYKHSWRKGGFMTVNRTEQNLEQENVQNVPIAPGLPTTVWEEIFVVNVKIANYLFGGIQINSDSSGYLVLQLHDYIVYMPLAIIFIQVCEMAVTIVLVILFFDYLVLQVTTACVSGVDCYDATDYNMSSLPLSCDDVPNNVTKFTCFHLSLNPVIAAAITGGFLKIAPHLMFSSVTYAYLKMLHFTTYFEMNKKVYFASHIAVAIVAEIVLLGGGIIILVLLLKMDSLRSITFMQANPMHQLTFIFCFVFYFLASSVVWCIYPLTKTAVRFQNSIWKQKVVAARGVKEKSPGKLRPWIVVDRSLHTEDEKLLTDEDD